MAYKTFESPDGTKWEVWRVLPTSAERRKSQRRSFAGSTSTSYDGPERRIGDRRLFGSDGQKFVSAGYENGWLCFESESGEKRRLAPVPDSWENATMEKLWMWCRAATQVLKCGPRYDTTPE